MQQKTQQRKWYIAEPSQYPVQQKADFSTTKAEKQALKEAKKLHKLQLMNAFGSSWKKHLNLTPIASKIEQIFLSFVKHPKHI